MTTPAPPASRPGAPAMLLLTAILLLALNLRLSVNAPRVVLPQIRAELGLSASAAGLLNALLPGQQLRLSRTEKGLTLRTGHG